MHPVITEICCCLCIKNDDDLCPVKLWSVALCRVVSLLSCLLVMVSDLRLKSYIRGCKIIYFLIDNSKFETDVRLIIILYIKECVLALCLFLGLLKFISSEWERCESGK